MTQTHDDDHEPLPPPDYGRIQRDSVVLWGLILAVVIFLGGTAAYVLYVTQSRGGP